MVTSQTVENGHRLDGLAGYRAAIALGFSITNLRQVKRHVR
jgi:hypothetical protein